VGWDLEAWADDILGLTPDTRPVSERPGKRGAYRPIARKRGYYRDDEISARQIRERPATPVLNDIGFDAHGRLIRDPFRRVS